MTQCKRRSQTSQAAETLKVLKSRNQRAELMVLSGANYSSNINLVQSGIAINKQINVEAPEFSADGLFAVGSKIFMRLFGHDQLVVCQAAMKSTGLTAKKTLQLHEVAGAEVTIGKDEQILSIC